MQVILQAYLPILLALGLGYALARWRQMKSTSLMVVLSNLLLPIYLFDALLGPVRQKNVLSIAALGAGVAITTLWLVPKIAESLKQRIEIQVALPNALLFALPVLSIAWNLKPGMRMAVATIFVAIALVSLVFSHRKQTLTVLTRQPWVYAVLAAAVVQYLKLPRGTIAQATDVLAAATPAVALVYLGSMLHPFVDFQKKERWITLGLFMAVSLLATFVGLKILSVPGSMHTTLLVSALAPPSALGFALLCGNGERSERDPLLAMGVVVSLALYMAFPPLVAMLG